ncbi:carbon storage regulator CsrA [Paenibacillus chungangensis]|uniref:Translational regulator CsrA n=1 Tax=Paenibacillus chungangensis TaxID=696535 RepID=A0ABW3HK74_9BACL
MLVLSRKRGESILIGDGVEVTILEVTGDGVKIGITAPSDVGILRKELYVSVEEMNIKAKQHNISALELKNQLGKMKK